MTPTLLNTKKAADILGLKPNTLEVWRYQGNGPHFLKIGRLVRYDFEDIKAYLEASHRKSTSDNGEMN